MILHISIDAHNPLQVATTLAEVLNGKIYKFFIPGSYLVMPFDNYGTHIVVFKEGDVWVPGNDVKAAQVLSAEPSKLVANHTAMVVPTTQEQIQQIGKREGWRVLTRKQGEGVPFSAIEFWVENRILFEFLTPEFVPQYLQTMQPEIIEKMFGLPIQLVPA
ncbi:hypothetical protein [Calothrix sp. PCC 6303]|uniref:hypothetical protein n=1 Tax=Calothrix sp. PCC 6303 TaxID=1170562 RepID=UPI0002A03DEE|nr:hypothetical protein [Calothrix sp. PCC 6303]AFZ02796.1 hypothetical protein Cal6303_3879 [Calothrix sp. PCC 6303]